MTTEEVASRYRTAPSTIRYWRMIGYGPKGRRVGRACSTTSAMYRPFWASLDTKAGD